MVISFIDVDSTDVSRLDSTLSALPWRVKSKQLYVTSSWTVGSQADARDELYARLKQRDLNSLPVVCDLESPDSSTFEQWLNKRHALIAASDICVFALGSAAGSAELVALVGLARAYGAKVLLVSGGHAAPPVLLELAYAVVPSRAIWIMLDALLDSTPPSDKDKSMGTVITGDVKGSTNAKTALRCKACGATATSEQAKDPLFAPCIGAQGAEHAWMLITHSDSDKADPK